MKSFLLLMALAIPFIATAQDSYIPPTRILRMDGYETYFRGEYFETTHRLDQAGAKVPLNQGDYFRRYQGELGFFYGATNELQFGVGARVRHHQASFMAANQQVDASSSGLQSGFVSGKYAFRPTGRMQYTLEGMFRYTPYLNELAANTPSDRLVLGDDGNEYSMGLGMTYHTIRGDYLTARGGFRNPGNEISNELYWQVEAALVWRYMSLVAGVDGVTSLKNDPYEGNVSARPNVNTGPSVMYNSVNREWIAPYAGVHLALGNHWRMELRGSQVVTGRWTDGGTGFSIHLAHRYEKSESKVVDSRFKEYDIEATVSKISPEKGYVVIDRGITSDVHQGMRFDFYEFDYVGGNVLVARGIVTQVKADSAIVKITHRYNVKKEVKTGMFARASIK
jgi:hypothetical protein